MQWLILKPALYHYYFNGSKFYSFKSRKFFMQTYLILLEKMIDNVPNNVVLAEAISPSSQSCRSVHHRRPLPAPFQNRFTDEASITPFDPMLRRLKVT